MSLQQVLQSLANTQKPRIAPKGVRPPFAGHSNPNVPLRPDMAPNQQPRGNWMQMLGTSLPVVLPQSQPDGDMTAPVMPGSTPKLAPAPQPSMAPVLNTQGSDNAYAQALRILEGMNQPQQTYQPQLKAENALLALLPAILGADTSYLPGLAQSYQNETERRQGLMDAERADKINRAKLFGGMKMDEAERMRGSEIAQFNQESQNFRNEQDNQRMMDAKKMDIDAAASRLRDTNNLKSFQALSKRIDAFLNDADGYTEAEAKVIDDAARIYADYANEDYETIIGLLSPPTVGSRSQKSLDSERLYQYRKDEAERKLKEFEAKGERWAKEFGFRFDKEKFNQAIQQKRLDLQSRGLDLREQDMNFDNDLAMEKFVTGQSAPKTPKDGARSKLESDAKSLGREIRGLEAALLTDAVKGDPQKARDFAANLATKRGELKYIQEQLDALPKAEAPTGGLTDAVRAGAQAVRECKDKASCANFASGALRSLGVKVPLIPGAKDLIDKVKSKSVGGVEVSQNEAKPGDLVYLYGRGYGAMKDEYGNGYHVGIYLGNGKMADSSNRSIRNTRSIPSGARFVTIPQGGGAMIGAMAGLGDKKQSESKKDAKKSAPKAPPISKQYSSTTATAPNMPPVSKTADGFSVRPIKK